MNRDHPALEPSAPHLPVKRVTMANDPVEEPGGTRSPAALRDGEGRMNTPPLVPARPPIRVEDGLVEVGWEGDLDCRAGLRGRIREASG